MENWYNYIHYFKSSYKYRQADVKDDQVTKKIKEQIRKRQKEASARLSRINATLPNGVALLDIAKQMEDFNLEKIAETDIQELSKNLNTMQVVAQLKKIEDVNQKVVILNNYLSRLNELVDSINKINDNLKFYYNQSLNKKLKSANLMEDVFGTTTGTFQILKINESGLTNFENLTNKIRELQKYAKSKTAFKTKNISYQYVKDGKVSLRTQNVVDSIASINGQISNIQGAVGEGMAALFLIKKSDELIKEFESNISKNKNVKVTVSGIGNQKINGVVSKADINFNIHTQNVDIQSKEYKDLIKIISSFKVSSKAVKIGSNPGKVKLAQSETLGKYVDVKNIDLLYRYLFLNMAVHTDYSSLYSALSRYVASLTLEESVAGYSQFDDVAIIMFLDKVLTIDQFYYYMIQNNRYPRVSIQGIKFVDTSPIPKNMVLNEADIRAESDLKNKFAFMRSKRVRNQLYGLRAQILF